MKYYMGYANFGMYRHLVGAERTSILQAECPPTTDPISYVLYKCLPVNKNSRSLCGVKLISYVRNLKSGKLVECADYWLDKDYTCLNCLRKYADARNYSY